MLEIPQTRVEYAQPSQPFCGLVILGEAPGAEEVRTGEPFTGRSGQLLDWTLALAGIDRRACLVANVFRYRPPQNKAAHFFQSRRDAVAASNSRSLVLGPSSYGYCRPEYLAEIDALEAALRGARAVLALGGVPLWATTGETALTPHAGLVMPSRLAALPVVPTYHPAFILRGRRPLIPTWAEHMQLALEQATGRNAPL